MTNLKEGDKAPDFTTRDQNGKELSLNAYAGKKLILYFYPKDDTSGCTAQSCNLRDNYTDLIKKGYEVVGVSADDEKSHQKFIKKFDLPFTLLADTDKKMLNDYGVWGEKSFMGKKYMGIIRTTFLIENEKIKKVFTDVDTKHHTEQILEATAGGAEK